MKNIKERIASKIQICGTPDNSIRDTCCNQLVGGEESVRLISKSLFNNVWMSITGHIDHAIINLRII